MRVGIIAVDPTSPYTGGAILGDRIRMQGHASDAGIFIRSMATRGFLGGLARTTGDVALVLDAAGKQYVLVETVGVGQDEVDIVRLADCTLVLLVPGMGDDVQNMKAGLMEIADIFVLNKSDRDGADRLEVGTGSDACNWLRNATAGSRESFAPWPRKIKAWTNSPRRSRRYRERIRATARIARNEKSNTGNAGLLALAGEAVSEARGFRRGWRSRARMHWRAKSPAAERIPTRPFANCSSRADGCAERRMKLGDLEFWLITDGTFRLDGGAMFGVIPKPDVGESRAAR